MGDVKFTRRFIRTSKVLKDLPNHSKRAKDLTKVMKAGQEAARKSVTEEFSGKYWKSPGGGKIAWKPRKDKKKHPLLFLSGDLFNSWMGVGKSIDKVTRSSFSIGSTEEYAKVQRGGSGVDISSHSLWRNIIPRPHGTRNPELDSKLNSMVSSFITRGIF